MKLGLEIWTGDRLNMTDVVGCFDATIASRCNQLPVLTQITILRGAKDFGKLLWPQFERNLGSRYGLVTDSIRLMLWAASTRI